MLKLSPSSAQAFTVLERFLAEATCCRKEHKNYYLIMEKNYCIHNEVVKAIYEQTLELSAKLGEIINGKERKDDQILKPIVGQKIVGQPQLDSNQTDTRFIQFATEPRVVEIRSKESPLSTPDLGPIPEVWFNFPDDSQPVNNANEEINSLLNPPAETTQPIVTPPIERQKNTDAIQKNSPARSSEISVDCDGISDISSPPTEPFTPKTEVPEPVTLKSSIRKVPVEEKKLKRSYEQQKGATSDVQKQKTATKTGNDRGYAAIRDFILRRKCDDHMTRILKGKIASYRTNHHERLAKKSIKSTQAWRLKHAPAYFPDEDCAYEILKYVDNFYLAYRKQNGRSDKISYSKGFVGDVLYPECVLYAIMEVKNLGIKDSEIEYQRDPHIKHRIIPLKPVEKPTKHSKRIKQ